MVTSLSIERSTQVNWTPRWLYSAVALLALSAFAKETATVAIDLPILPVVHAEARPVVALTPVASLPVTTAVAPAMPLVPVPANPAAKQPSPAANPLNGMASWYGAVLQGHRTASGRLFDMYELTAAHRSLPFGSKVKVTNQRTRKSVIVTVTDRGVLNADRVIDLSYAAAEKLGMLKSGVDPVTLQVLTPRQVLVAEASAAPQQ